MAEDNCEATKKCNLGWGMLQRVGHSKNRYCRHCKRAVRLCHTKAEVSLNAAIGRCVAYQPEQVVRWLGETRVDYKTYGSAVLTKVTLDPNQLLNERQRQEIQLLYRTREEGKQALARFDNGESVLLCELDQGLVHQLVKDLEGDLAIKITLVRGGLLPSNK